MWVDIESTDKVKIIEIAKTHWYKDWTGDEFYIKYNSENEEKYWIVIWDNVVKKWVEREEIEKEMNEMRIEVAWHVDMWQEIKNSAMFTIHKITGKYPDSNWKKHMLLAEHSPIRSGRLIINCYNVPSFVIGHIVRHNLGFVPFVSSLRTDRFESGEIPNRMTPNNLRFDGNFQSFINISRRRLCKSASIETQMFWKKVLEKVKEFEPEVESACKPECVYRGWCYEYPKSCGWFKTEAYKKELNEYRKGINDWNEESNLR